MTVAVHEERRGRVAILRVDNPPVNALSQAVRSGIADGIARAATDDGVDAIVLACDGRTFIAGADIREFGKPNQPPHLPDVVTAIEDCAKPVVAAIHGTALGGGLEVALGCHFRVAIGSARCGLPEVKLGLLPGAGGTQRLPRVIGVEKALAMIVGGEPIGAAEARELGLVDALIEGELLAGAIAFAEQVVAEGRPLRKVRELTGHIDAARGDMTVFDNHEQKIAKKKRGFEAPFRCIDAVRAAVELPFDEGMAKERQLFSELVRSDQARAQQHVFFAERQVARVPDVPRDTPVQRIETVGIIGAGTMGAGIATAFADAGMEVTLLDREQSFVDRGLSTIDSTYASSVKRGRIAEAEAAARRARVRGATDYAELAQVDLVVEAVFEELDVKREVFKQLDAVCKPDAILATNTSTLDVDAIAACTSRPERVIGLHFFSPAHIMKLLEIVRGKATDKSLVATALSLGKQLGKIGVVVGVCPGFVGNRILYQYRREALFLVEEGASPQQVDRVITDFGLPMGPFAMNDLAGLDIGWRVRKAEGKPAGQRYSGTVPDRLCEMGRLGQKSRAGFYRYEDGSRTPRPDPEVDALIREVATELGVEQREIGDEEIIERCIYPMINEGAKILEEGVAIRPGDIDIVWINGYGFPAYRGGPMCYADLVGLDTVHAALQRLEQQHGDVWKPAPLLSKLVAEGKRFADL